MASSSGSFPGFLRRSFERGRCAGVFAVFLLSAAAALGDPLPDYLRTALAQFSPNPPKGWAYTLATTRNDQRMVERYEPSRPPAGQWTLLEWQGRPPTADELEKYARSRPQGGSGGTRANFERADIELASLRLVRDDADQAEWTGGFRETSAGPDKMLGHLQLTLVVDKRTPHIAAYRLELKEPYSPVLGVKMNRLLVEMRYQSPAEGRPALPIAQTSSFGGRIFFIPTEEELRLTFADYAAPPTELSR